MGSVVEERQYGYDVELLGSALPAFARADGSLSQFVEDAATKVSYSLRDVRAKLSIRNRGDTAKTNLGNSTLELELDPAFQALTVQPESARVNLPDEPDSVRSQNAGRSSVRLRFADDVAQRQETALSVFVSTLLGFSLALLYEGMRSLAKLRQSHH